MKKSILNVLRYLRYLIILLVLATFTAIFSGFILHNQQIIQATEVQFLPAVLTAIGLGGMTAVGIMIFFAALTAFFGRLYCSWCCPLGLLQEVIERLDRWIFRKKERQYRPGHPVFRVAFFVFSTVSMLCGISLFIGYFEPYSLFGKISSSIVRHLLTLLNVNTVKMPQSALEHTTAWSIALGIYGGFLLALTLLVILKGRIFCNTLCPAGAILAFITAKSKRRLTIDKDKCVKCGKCEKSCNAHCIDIKNSQKIDFTRCFMCLECVRVCPVDAIRCTRRAPHEIDMPAAPELRNMLIAAGVTAAATATAGVLGKKTSGKITGIVPPGAGSTEEFLKRCTGCGLCIANCRGDCLQPATTEYSWRGFMLPVMKFTGTHPGKCEYECNNCTANCPTGALKQLTLAEKKVCRIGMAHFFPKNCVAYADGEPCGACAEHCPTGALQMVKGPHKFATIPKVIPDLCIGCGNCQFACPVTPQAIQVHSVNKQTRATSPEEYHKKEEVKQAPSSIPF